MLEWLAAIALVLLSLALLPALLRQTKRNLARRGRSGILVGIGLGLASLFDPKILETIEIVEQKKDEAEDEESGQEL